MYRDELGVAPLRQQQAASARPASLPWIRVAPGAPYFMTEAGEAWTPIGQNDAISWIEFKGLFGRRDLDAVDAHLRWLADHGVTCLRLMMEYAQERHRYFERPLGTFSANMVRLWDDVFALCERHGLRILLTPFDTFWTWMHWRHHPYNRRNGGCLDGFDRVLLCPEARRAIKARLSFAVERWGGSGALFAWDLWNEIHPAQAAWSADGFGEFIHDLSRHVRGLERRLYGRSHPQTVSLFGPELIWQPDMPLKEPIFRHPDLDFATLHIYEEGTIDDPVNTVDAAVGMGGIVRRAIAEIEDARPFLDTEHGPIHTFKDKKRTLPERFDDEYFRHMQWAHMASGGAGGGMRWPNRKPHKLTSGMRKAQAALARFLPLIDWARFPRVPLNDAIRVSGDVAAFGCGDDAQALVWLLRKDVMGRDGTLRRDAPAISPEIVVPALAPGRYRVTAWDTLDGAERGVREIDCFGEGLALRTIPFATDLALAIRRG
jgi:mannan endo-1,4-beta-mannosidase